LLDINLSDGSGFELCKKIRQTLNIPILFISARNTDDDKIIALNIGGDDYIEKPYSLGVLLAKVKVVLKRFGGAETEAAPKSDFDDGYLRMDTVNKTVFVNGEEKKITSIEWKLLNYLIENKNRLVTKNEIFEITVIL
jgi:two-component system response regulator RegX3